MKGKWQVVRTDAGWHVRLSGGNGEPMLTSEVYTEKGTAFDALNVVMETPPEVVAEIDERTPANPHEGVEERGDS